MNAAMLRSVASLAVACAAGVVVLSVVGEALAPTWRTAPYRGEPLASPPGGSDQPVADTEPAASFEVRREDTEVPVRGARLAATVFAPATPGRHPAVAFVQGAGSNGRNAFLGMAEDFARAGIVAVAYDKRSDYSYLGNRDFDQLAEDAAAVAAMLRRRPDVDPARAGLWGLSEGGRVVPLAASRHAEIGFAVVVSGAVRGPLRNTIWSVQEGLARAGSPSGARRLAAQVLGAGRIATLHLDPPQDTWEKVRQPVLLVYGTEDFLVPPAESTRAVADGLRRGGNTSYTVAFFGGADHGLRVDGKRAPGYLRTITDWITGLPASGATGGRVTGPAPRQRFASVPLPEPRWYGGIPALAVTIGLMVVGYLVVPGILRRRARAGGGPWPAVEARTRILARSSTATFIGLWVYIGLLVGLGYTRNGSAVLFHAGWGVLRFAALGAVVLAVLATRELIVARADGWSATGAQRATLAVSLGTSAVLLLTAAYWGLYGPRW
ncbi:alpha/beta hydrolase family protein [Phytohabitans houttuyneae]|uniref:alpha/beta hydrolase family protein n=1 Tax=Phytohabitans houttuyneae TaxID=1076126 RepID=UPI0031F0FB78